MGQSTYLRKKKNEKKFRKVSGKKIKEKILPSLSSFNQPEIQQFACEKKINKNKKQSPQFLSHHNQVPFTLTSISSRDLGHITIPRLLLRDHATILSTRETTVFSPRICEALASALRSKEPFGVCPTTSNTDPLPPSCLFRLRQLHRRPQNLFDPPLRKG